ncbi:octopamine receptor beta-2R-like isoform X2 [Actinia tenebrosa]|nr:octopamine receptor beta-2R-like isoform X2 [Actinia tenebrosa]XP_031565160.1 octopamine receptor beta-2R-like isoform X2 [Actinia tenebrosa]
MTSSDIQNTSFLSPQHGQIVLELGAKHVILSISLVLIQFFAIFGNTMLFLVVYRKPHLRTRTNMFILNLAFADLGVAILCMPFSVITCVRQSWVFGDALCQFNGFINITFAMCSLLTLTAIGIDKYFTIVKPLDRVMTRQRALLMLAVAWVEPVLFASLPLTGFTRYEYKQGSSQCGVQNPVSLAQTIHAGLVFLVAYVIPLSIMGFAYVKIYKTARLHNRRMSHTSMTTRVSTSRSIQNQIALTIFIMLMVFIICWTPYFIYVAYITANHVTNDLTGDLGLAAYWCVFLNSALNPYIYGIRNPHFRAAFKEVWMSATRSFCSLFSNVKKRGYSNSSTTVTKTSQASPNNNVSSRSPSVLLMCSSQIAHTGSDEKSEKDVEKGCKAQEDHDLPEHSELQDKRSDYKPAHKTVENQLNYNTPLISHINQGFEDKDSCCHECSRTIREQNIHNCDDHSLLRQQCVSRNIPHGSSRRMLRPHTHPQTKPCNRLDTRTEFKMATHVRIQRRCTHAHRKSTGRTNQMIHIGPRGFNINSHVNASDSGTCQSQLSCKIRQSKENRKRRKMHWIETYL